MMNNQSFPCGVAVPSSISIFFGRLSRFWALGTVALGTLVAAGCSGGGSSPDFRYLPLDAGWEFGIADYTDVTAPTDVVAKSAPLPSPFTGNGIEFAATNNSDDALVYGTRILDGFAPGSRWRIALDPEIVTTTPTGCAGVGGSPGEGVWVVSAVSGAPIRTKMVGDEVRIDLDRGNQSQGGTQGLVLGTIAGTSTDCRQPSSPESKSFLSPRFIEATADSQGRIWVLIGMDSGFEARSRIWIRSIRVRLDPV